MRFTYGKCNISRFILILALLILTSILVIHLQLQSHLDHTTQLTHHNTVIGFTDPDDISTDKATIERLQSDVLLAQNHYETAQHKQQITDLTNEYQDKINDLEHRIATINSNSDGSNPNIVRIIWILWFQGWTNAPMIPQIVLKSWKTFNDKDWIIIPVDETNLPFYVDNYQHWRDFVYLKYSWAGFSDIIRIELLRKYGGVWADSTVFCTKPLNEWLLDNINENGFFAFDHPRKNTQISSWFMTSLYANQSYIINTLYAQMYIYWRERHVMDKYWWLHGIFDGLYDTDSQFREHYDTVTKWSADGPHKVKHAKSGLPGIPINRKVIEEIDADIQPMYKLDKSVWWTWNTSDPVWNSNLGHLFTKYITINETTTFSFHQAIFTQR